MLQAQRQVVQAQRQVVQPQAWLRQAWQPVEPRAPPFPP